MHYQETRNDLAIDIMLMLGTFGALFIFGVCALPMVQM